MWTLENHTPFAAERAWVRDRNGGEVWIVAVKGTFLINPDGTTSVAEKQEVVRRAPEYRGEPGKSSLLYESDLILSKPGTDIILHGHAHAGYGKPAYATDVRIRVADMEKTLRVFGDRYWDRGLFGLKISKPRPFEKIPITYERAYGGIDQAGDNPNKHDWEPRNPVGAGFAVAKKHLPGKMLPNVEYPENLITSWKHRPRPAGFGPIAGGWAPRLQLAGTYDDRWQKERQPLLPEDFDERHFLCAPEDQRFPQHLRGGEPVGLFNLTPRGALRFNLPRVVLRFTTNFYKGDSMEHRAVLHTVILEPDVPRVMMVWHTALPCHHRVQKLKETVIRQKKMLFALEQQPETAYTKKA